MSTKTSRRSATSASNKKRKLAAYNRWLAKRQAKNLVDLPAKLEAKRIKMLASSRRRADKEIAAALKKQDSSITKNQVPPITATIEELTSNVAQA